MSNFAEFLDSIKDFKEKPVKLKQIKKLLKINEKSFPPCKNILNYYFQEFAKRTNEEHRTKWHRKDKILFVWTVLKYFELSNRSDLNPTEQDWQYLAKVLGISEQLLNLKWISMLKTNLKMAPWHQQEDDILQTLITDPSDNKNWTQITIDFNRINPIKIVRHAKQIRERWNNYLNPILKKSEWTKQEQLQLLLLVQEIGKRWSLISKRIQGRTENQVKNQYNSMMNNYRRYNQLDNEDIAINKLLANLQGRDYDGPQPIQTKRIRKQYLQPKQSSSPQQQQQQQKAIPPQGIEVEMKEVKEEHNQNQDQQPPLMLNLPVFSPIFSFQTPLQYIMQQSPNNIQSPYEITKQTNYHSSQQLFDELLKSTQEVRREVPDVPCFLRMFNSPAFNPQGYHPYGAMNYTQQQQQQQQNYNTKKIKTIQKELLKFDQSLKKDI